MFSRFHVWDTQNTKKTSAASFSRLMAYKLNNVIMFCKLRDVFKVSANSYGFTFRLCRRVVSFRGIATPFSNVLFFPASNWAFLRPHVHVYPMISHEEHRNSLKLHGNPLGGWAQLRWVPPLLPYDKFDKQLKSLKYVDAHGEGGRGWHGYLGYLPPCPWISKVFMGRGVGTP